METNEVIQDKSLTVGDWLITLIITAIPIVGFIMLFVWAFSKSTPTSKANWAKAALILFAIVILLYIIAFAIFGATILGLVNQDVIDSQTY